jgi:CheY-like chemotaxis protein
MNSHSRKKSILVVDDSPGTLEVLQRNLTAEGYITYTAAGAMEALKLLEGTPVDLVITDLKMPKISGIDLIRHIRQNYRNTEVMMITGYATVESAVEAVKSGAEQYLCRVGFSPPLRKRWGKPHPTSSSPPCAACWTSLSKNARHALRLLKSGEDKKVRI